MSTLTRVTLKKYFLRKWGLVCQKLKVTPSMGKVELRCGRGQRIDLRQKLRVIGRARIRIVNPSCHLHSIWYATCNKPQLSRFLDHINWFYR